MNAKIENFELSDIIDKIAVHVHEQGHQRRETTEIPDGIMVVYSDCMIFPLNDGTYQAIHYVVYVDNKSERFYIVLTVDATENEYLDSLDFSK
jgi:hypothetical protein